MLVRKKNYIDVLAKVWEYEHALDHIMDTESHRDVNPCCSDCVGLAKSAIDGSNHQDMVDDLYEEFSIKGRLRRLYYNLKYFRG